MSAICRKPRPWTKNGELVSIIKSGELWKALVIEKYGKDIAEASRARHGGDWRSVLVDFHVHGAWQSRSVNKYVNLVSPSNEVDTHPLVAYEVEMVQCTDNMMCVHVDIRSDLINAEQEDSGLEYPALLRELNNFQFVVDTAQGAFYIMSGQVLSQSFTVIPYLSVPGHFKGYLKFELPETPSGEISFVFAGPLRRNTVHLVTVFLVNVDDPCEMYTVAGSTPFSSDSAEVERQRWIHCLNRVILEP